MNETQVQEIVQGTDNSVIATDTAAPEINALNPGAEVAGIVPNDVTTQPPVNSAGMLIILAVVVVLMVLTQLIDKAKRNAGKKAEGNSSTPAKPAAPVSKPVAAAAVKTAAVPTPVYDDGDEIAAVIAAAVTMALEAEQTVPSTAFTTPAARPTEQPVNGLLVRRARRRGAAVSGWNRAGREEQIYSRL